MRQASALVSHEVRDALENGPECPEEGAHLWEWFAELNKRRVSTGFGIAPISFGEIESWQRLRRLELDPWELEGLLELDDIYRRIMADPSRDEAG